MALPAPASRDGLFVVELDRFQGPLDLLLHLIRQQDLDIFDIPIARITDQFLSAVKGIEAVDLDGAGEFLEMAATLVRIKVQMLLPRPGVEEDEDPRAELVRRLLEYEQIREITERLERAEAERARRFTKGHVPPRRGVSAGATPLETTWDEVFRAAIAVTLPRPHGLPHRVTGRSVTLEEKLGLIMTSLQGVPGIEFRSLLRPFQERAHGVMTFLAGLELSRRRRIRLRQAEPFHELWLYRREDAPEGDEGDAVLADEPRRPATEPPR
jgi:segregation and condensation protein A